MADNLQSWLGIQQEQAKAAENYINDLMGQAQGDRDFIISQLKRDHDLALGSDDKARAKFLESVADKLEEKIGRIPYDYQVGTTRTQQNLARTQEVTQRNKSQALARLAEDEKVWKQEFGDASTLAKGTQQEALLKRGILSGTRENAQGLAGQEARRLDTDLASTLEAYDRALGRSRQDIETQVGDTLFEAQRSATRAIEDLKTEARRGSIDTQDRLKFGTEGANRQFEAKRKEIERLRRQEEEVAKRSPFEYQQHQRYM